MRARSKCCSCWAGTRYTHAPADLDFAGKLDKVPAAIHVSLHPNETSACARWLVPERHFLEGWSDARAFDGTVTILQPLIEPLYRGRSYLEVLDALVRRPARPHTTSCDRTGKRTANAGEFERCWRKSVRAGLVAGSALPAISPSLRGLILLGCRAAVSGTGLDLLFRTDPFILDGRYANNAWLQELPQPHHQTDVGQRGSSQPANGETPGLENQHHGRTEVRRPFCARVGLGVAWPGGRDGGRAPRLRPHARRATSETARDSTHIVLRVLGCARGRARAPRFAASPANLSACQHADAPEYGRARHGDLSAGRELPEGPRLREEAHEIPEKQETIYPLWDYTGYAWGMSVDLTACVNCMACVIACQAENNIPVVGKEQVLVQPRNALAAGRYLLRRRSGSAPRCATSRFPACNARMRPANWSARSRPPLTAPTASTT